MSKNASIQDYLLNELRKTKTHTNIFLVNGTVLRNCIITGFDLFVVVVENQKKQKVLYKHAISTLEPEKKIDLMKKK